MSNTPSSVELILPKSNLPKGPTSIFQLCYNLSQRLRCIPNFDSYINLAQKQLEQDEFYDPILGIDPVTLLWKTFRQGTSLIAIYNALETENPITETKNDLKKENSIAKYSIFHFTKNCREKLGFKEEELFTISELFSDNTNAFVKVLKTISLLLDKMEEKKIINTSHLNLNGLKAEDPTDNRARVIKELLETERKYIVDLEKLQNFKQECQNTKTLSRETIDNLFNNLHHLVDFQRRFLIGVECNALLPAEEQRYGGLFLSMENAFACYEPFCANYKHASDLVIKETPNLQSLAHVCEPTYELPSLLIKPIQRICKYPLLLRELIKYTEEEEYPHFLELKMGMEAIERVAGRVNEMRRKDENAILLDDLKTRVVNWDALNVDDFGELLQHDKFLVVGKDQKEREMYIFMFETILICCKELASTSRRSKLAVKKSTGAPLELRGEIFTKNLVKVVNRNQDSEILLRLYWRDEGMQILILKCRNEEQVRLWKPPLDQIILKHKMASLQLDDRIEPNGSPAFSSLDDSLALKPHNAPLPAIPRFIQQDMSINGAFRNRSASSPNIHANLRSMPLMPQTNATISVRSSTFDHSNGDTTDLNGIHRNQNGRMSSANIFQDTNRPASSPVPPPRRTNSVIVKLNYMDDVFVIMVPLTIDFETLLEKVERKLRLCGGRQLRPEDDDLSLGFRVRYRDEDNDFITINSDDDVQMAFESSKATSESATSLTINLYVD